MTQENSELSTLDIQQLLVLLPHRYPFLLVDRIVDIDRDVSARGIKNVTFNEPHFTGHFPDNPIMPGVLIIEGMAQTAGAIVSAENYTDDPKTTYFMTIDKAKFRKTVVPGDTLEYLIRKKAQKRNIFKYTATAEVNGQKVAEAEIGAMMMSRHEQ